MLHEPAGGDLGPDHAAPYKTRLGLIMFAFYALIYAVFVVLNVVDPLLMEKASGVLGLNLAVAFGFGLIVLALVMAVIYNHMCTSKERQLNGDDQAKEGAA